MPTAYVFIRRESSYPREAVASGLRVLGYEIGTTLEYRPGNVVVTWNSYGSNKTVAERMRASGGKHVVMENGYFRRQDRYFLVNRNGFCGEEHPVLTDCSPDRFRRLGVAIKPWRAGGSKVLVCGQRGGGYNHLAMTNTWPDKVLWGLRNFTSRPLMYRPHPERPRIPIALPEGCWVESADKPMVDLLDDVHAVVVWTSNAATEALLEGVPVVYDGPSIACRDLAVRGIENVEHPVRPRREQTFYDLAWRQFNEEEIASGYALEKVLSL